MRELVYYVAVSLDGYIAAPDGGFGDFLNEGDHIEMIFDEFTDTIPAPFFEQLPRRPRRFDTVLMGRSTYEAGLPHSVDNPYPHLRQYVFSRSLDDLPDNITLTSEDPVDVVKQLKAEEGLDIWLCGGGHLAGSLRPEIDRLILKVNPVALGSGISLFDGTRYEAESFELVASRSFQTGVVVNEYVASR